MSQGVPSTNRTFEGRRVYQVTVIGKQTVPDGDVDKGEQITCVAADIVQATRFAAAWAFNNSWAEIRVIGAEEVLDGAKLFDADSTFE